MIRSGIHFILLVLLLFIVVPAIGNDSAIVIKLHSSFGMKYIFDAASRDCNSNYILKDIANDAVKNLRSTRLNLAFDLQMTLEPGINRSCRMKLAFLNPSLNGDSHFRGFDVSDVLLPDRVDFELKVSGKADSSGYREFIRDNFPVTWKDSAMQEHDFPSADPRQDSIQLSSVYFYYDEDALNRFQERLTLIHEYYASSAIVDSLLTLAYSMDMQNEEHYPEYFIFLEEINKVVEIIGQKKIREVLKLSEYDPKDFRKKYIELFKLSKSLTMTFEEHLEKAESIHPVITVDSVITLFISGMTRYINWTLLVNERNGNVYNEYLDNYYLLNAFGDDILTLKKLLGKISPGVHEDTLLSRIFHQIFLAYNTKSLTLIRQNLFAEAIALMENARRFSAYNPFPEEVMDDDTTRLIATKGIFSSYLSIAEQSIRNRKFEMAETYLAKARAYRQANFSYPIPDSLYKSVFLELVQEQIADCNSLAAEKKFRESLDCFRYFEASYDSSSIAMILADLKIKKERVYRGLVDEMLNRAKKCDLSGDPDSALILFDFANKYMGKMDNCSMLQNRIDSMTPDFDNLRYRQLLTKASSHFQRRQYLLAYTEMNKAKTIFEKYHYYVDTLFKTLWSQVYPQYLQYLLWRAEKMIWVNQLQDALIFADSIAGLQSSMGFGSDTELSMAIEKYRSRISEKGCLNATEALEVYGIRAQHYLEQKNFLRAEILLDSAVWVSENAKDCHLPIGTIRDTLHKYMDAASFQRSLADIENHVSVNQYTEALVKYMETELFFSAHQIARFGVACETVFDYVKEKSNLRLTFAAIELLKGKEEYPEALEYLKIYRLQGGESGDVKEIQRSAGKEMANADFVRTPGKDPAVLTEAYTGHDKWMANFERNYLVQWNLLRSDSLSRKSN